MQSSENCQTVVRQSSGRCQIVKSLDLSFITKPMRLKDLVFNNTAWIKGFRILLQTSNGILIDCIVRFCDDDDCNAGKIDNGSSMNHISIFAFIAVMFISFMNQ